MCETKLMCSIDHQAERIIELETQLRAAVEGLERIGELSDADKDHTFVIVRDALATIKNIK